MWTIILKEKKKGFVRHKYCIFSGQKTRKVKFTRRFAVSHRNRSRSLRGQERFRSVLNGRRKGNRTTCIARRAVFLLHQRNPQPSSHSGSMHPTHSLSPHGLPNLINADTPLIIIIVEACNIPANKNALKKNKRNNKNVKYAREATYSQNPPLCPMLAKKGNLTINMPFLQKIKIKWIPFGFLIFVKCEM